MQWICTLLASFALVWGQIVASDSNGTGLNLKSGSGVESPASACCKAKAHSQPAPRSCCPKSCCIEQAPSSSAPSAPASNSGSSSRALFFAVHATLLRFHATAPQSAPDQTSASFGALTAPTVPLFLRHGVFLI
jgi:hypothetical protein